MKKIRDFSTVLLARFYTWLGRVSMGKLNRLKSVSNCMITACAVVTLTSIVAIIGCFSTIDLKTTTELEEQAVLAQIGGWVIVMVVSGVIFCLFDWVLTEVREEISERLAEKRKINDDFCIRDLDKELNVCKCKVLMVSPERWDKTHRPGVRK